MPINVLMILECWNVQMATHTLTVRECSVVKPILIMIKRAQTVHSSILAARHAKTMQALSDPCNSPPCINYQCQPHNCYLQNKDLSGGDCYDMGFCLNLDITFLAFLCTIYTPLPVQNLHLNYKWFRPRTPERAL